MQQTWESCSHAEDPHSPRGTHGLQTALHLLSNATFPCPSSLPIQGTWMEPPGRGIPGQSDSWQREPAQHPKLRPRFPMSLCITKQPVQPHKQCKTYLSEVLFTRQSIPQHCILASKEDHGLVPSPPAPAQTLFPDGRQKPVATRAPESSPGDAPWAPRAGRGSRWQLGGGSWGRSPSVLAQLEARALLLISGRLAPEAGAAPGRLLRQSLHVPEHLVVSHHSANL